MDRREDQRTFPIRFFLPDQNFQLLQSFYKFHRGICPASKNPENFQLAVTQP